MLSDQSSGLIWSAPRRPADEALNRSLLLPPAPAHASASVRAQLIPPRLSLCSNP